MAFKFIIAIALFAGYAVAGEYEYRQPSTVPTLTPPAVNVNSLENNTSNDFVNSNYSLPNTHENSQAAPSGNDYVESRQFANEVRNPSEASSTGAVTAPVAAANIVTLPVKAPVYFPPVKYDYSYAVHDDTTGDIKDHSESSDGYYVRGTYSLIDPDGFKRTVTYTADDVNGFNAVVSRVPYALKTLITKTSAAPIVAAAKVASKESIESAENPVSPSTVVAFNDAQSDRVKVESSKSDLTKSAVSAIQPRDSYATTPVPRAVVGPYP